MGFDDGTEFDQPAGNPPLCVCENAGVKATKSVHDKIAQDTALIDAVNASAHESVEVAREAAAIKIPGDCRLGSSAGLESALKKRFRGKLV